jgi:hypothetical protein
MGYQQALTDFAITDLLHRIDACAHGDKLANAEIEALAAILIQALATHLNTSTFLDSYKEAMGYTPLHAATLLGKLHLPRPLTDLPSSFPHVEPPRFLDGDRLRWKTAGKTVDWGIVMGRFYSFAPHCRCWQWCYLIWLDPAALSSAWVKADIAWEDDLEPLKSEPLS